MPCCFVCVLLYNNSANAVNKSRTGCNTSSSQRFDAGRRELHEHTDWRENGLMTILTSAIGPAAAKQQSSDPCHRARDG